MHLGNVLSRGASSPSNVMFKCIVGRETTADGTSIFSEAYKPHVWGVDFFSEAHRASEWEKEQKNNAVTETPEYIFKDINLKFARAFKLECGTCVLLVFQLQGVFWSFRAGVYFLF